MLTIDILISVKDKKIVRIKEALPEAQEGVKYIICFQYTDEKVIIPFAGGCRRGGVCVLRRPG